MKKFLLIIIFFTSSLSASSAQSRELIEPQPPSCAPDNGLFVFLAQRDLNKCLEIVERSPEKMRERDANGNTVLMKALQMNYPEAINLLMKPMLMQESSMSGTTRIDGDYIYVGKTKYIYELISSGSFYFLSWLHSYHTTNGRAL
jgi:hypothetical protein